ncbi:MAG TPA: uL15 family ribosomal protein [Firmicutes bacterium]|nr:uL15 family ribosomal protein [Bacillota bacterium]
MANSLLAITSLHIVLFAVAAFLVALIILLAVIFLCTKKNRTENHADVSAKPLTDSVVSSAVQPVAEQAPAEEPTAEPVAEQAPAEEPVAEPAEEQAPAEEAVEEPAEKETSFEAPVTEVAEEETPAEESVAEPVAEQAPAEETVEEPAEKETSVEEPVAEPVAEQVPAEEPVADKSEEQLMADKPAEDGTSRIVYTSEDGWYVRVRYDRSFEAKLIQADDTLKRWYSELKNELLSYKKVTSRLSWQHEAFRLGRGTVAKLVIRGKTLRIYLALDPSAYDGSKYVVEDASEHAKFEKTPLLYRIRSERRCRYAKELIAAAIAALGGDRGQEQDTDYASVPYENTQELIGRGLVRIVEVRRRTQGGGKTELLADEDEAEDEDDLVVESSELEAETEEETAAEPASEKEQEPETESEPEAVEEPEPEPLPDPAVEHRVSVAVAEQLMTDEEALVLAAEAGSDRQRQTIVNIDTLGEYFADGERVTIDEMRERIPFFDQKATSVKVLARGVLNKTLEVEADDFSLAAVKMILLLGGKAYVRKS